jgi:hypothetical protein
MTVRGCGLFNTACLMMTSFGVIAISCKLLRFTICGLRWMWSGKWLPRYIPPTSNHQQTMLGNFCVKFVEIHRLASPGVTRFLEIFIGDS